MIDATDVRLGGYSLKIIDLQENLERGSFGGQKNYWKYSTVATECRIFTVIKPVYPLPYENDAWDKGSFYVACIEAKLANSFFAFTTGN